MGFNNHAQRSTPPYYLDVDNPLPRSIEIYQKNYIFQKLKHIYLCHLIQSSSQYVSVSVYLSVCLSKPIDQHVRQQGKSFSLL